MLFLGEKLGVLAFWTLVDSYPAAVSIVAAQVYVCTFTLVFLGQYTAFSGYRLYRFCKSPPSLDDLLKADKIEFDENISSDIPVIESSSLKGPDTVKRVRFFEGEPSVHIYEPEFPQHPRRHQR